MGQRYAVLVTLVTLCSVTHHLWIRERYYQMKLLLLNQFRENEKSSVQWKIDHSS